MGGHGDTSLNRKRVFSIQKLKTIGHPPTEHVQLEVFHDTMAGEQCVEGKWQECQKGKVI